MYGTTDTKFKRFMFTQAFGKLEDRFGKITEFAQKTLTDEMSILKLDSELPAIRLVDVESTDTFRPSPVVSLWKFEAVKPVDGKPPWVTMTKTPKEIGQVVWDSIQINTDAFEQLFTEILPLEIIAEESMNMMLDEKFDGSGAPNIMKALRIVVLTQAMVAHSVKYDHGRMHGTTKKTYEKDMAFIQTRAYFIHALTQVSKYFARHSSNDMNDLELVEKIYNYYQ